MVLNFPNSGTGSLAPTPTGPCDLAVIFRREQRNLPWVPVNLECGREHHGPQVLNEVYKAMGEDGWVTSSLARLPQSPPLVALST